MLTFKHSQELQESAIDKDIQSLNFRSLEGPAAHNYLLYSEKLKRTNPGVLARGILTKYTFLDDGGWWCSGVDPLNNYQSMLWGCFKPNRPRFDFEKRKHIKYEHPPKEETRVFLLMVPDYIWEKVSDRHNILITDEDRARGFWSWVWRCNVPITITEGAKKAGALLSAGYAAIALPGVNSGYRTPKDEFGEKAGRPYLIPDLKHFATLGREVSFCFDHDAKAETSRMVNNAVTTTAHLFAQEGCKVRVIEWDTYDKGVDDFIVGNGVAAFDQVYQTALTLEAWEARSFTQLTYPTALKVNRRYLGDILIPDDAKLVALKAPKGTGKTQLLEGVVNDAFARGQWVLVPGHRVQLVEALCQRFGLPYVTEVKSSETGATLGYGLCVDSLHPGSQARFNAEGWKDGVVIVDECEQVFWHALNSSTCQTQRIPILRELKTLLGNVLQGNGRVFLADADLSDLSINFVRSLAGVDVKPWIVLNEWKPGSEDSWDVYDYSGKNPSGLVDALETHIADDGKPLIICSAQKSKSNWSTRTLESHFSKLFPNKRILRIDSESIADPAHPAYRCIANLNTILGDYDVILASPSIETGVSIDLKGHFTSVWGIFQGVQAETSARQALARLRAPVDRHIWAAPYGISKIGNGSTSIKSLLASQHKLARANIKLLQDAAFDDIELNFQTESLMAWSKMAIRINSGMSRYRQAVLDGLKAEGHQIIDMGEVVSDSVKEAVTEVRDENHQAEAEAISSSPEISHSDFEKLQDKKSKTEAERHTERKHSLELRYAVPVDNGLVLKDDDGWYPKLRLHYFLTAGREFLKLRDGQRVRALHEKGNGAVWLPDLNKGQMSASIAAMQRLGVLELLTPEREFRSTDDQLQKMAKVAKDNPRDIKTALNISVKQTDTPIAIAQKLLGKFGFKLDCLRREGSRGNQQRVYGLIDPGDDRKKVFAAWLERDAEAMVDAAEAAAKTSADTEVSNPDDLVATPIPVVTAGNKDITTPPVTTKPVTTEIKPLIPQLQVAAGSIVHCIGRVGYWTVKYCTGIVAKVFDRYGDEQIVSCQDLRLVEVTV